MTDDHTAESLNIINFVVVFPVRDLRDRNTISGTKHAPEHHLTEPEPRDPSRGHSDESVIYCVNMAMTFHLTAKNLV
jgi:hypothetical protein